MLALVGGFALAAGLTQTSVTENGAWFGSTATVAPTNFPSSPTLNIGSSSGTCVTSGAYTGGTPVAFNVLQPSSGTCVAGDFAQTWVFSSAITTTTGTDTFQFCSTWGSLSTSNCVPFTLTVTGGSSSATVTFNLEYATASPPAGGVASTSVTVTGT